MEPNESPLSTSPSSSNVSQTRHFYLAVDRPQFKMETLVDLLGMAGRLCSIPIVVSCSTRDELDAVLSAVSSISHITMAALYSDLPGAERARVLAWFRQATIRWNKQATAEHVAAGKIDREEEKSHLIVVTDVCLPLINSGESPISARVLINYELPTKKILYPHHCMGAAHKLKSPSNLVHCNVHNSSPSTKPIYIKRLHITIFQDYLLRV